MHENLIVGSHVYIIENMRCVTEAVIAAIQGFFFTLKLIKGGAVRLRKSRIFLMKGDAEANCTIPKQIKRGYRSPYDYGA